MANNRICELFKIKYPIVQAGMVWCSGWKLAVAVSEQGGLGLIGAGSMDTEILKIHINKIHKHTNNPFGVNIPLIKNDVDQIIKTVIEEKVPIVFTSAGNPAKWTNILQDAGIKVVHVVANTKGAIKSVEAGVDALVVEGFEAGGHNGREETTTITLVPLIKKVTDIPLLAAGGISNGRSMLAAMALGADGVQIGSLFAVSRESSAHDNFKKRICEIKEGETRLILKKLIPVRLAFNNFYIEITEAENHGASVSELLSLLGKGRAKKAIFDGDIDNGEVEIGQVSALINEIKPVSQIFNELITEYNICLGELINEKGKYKF